MVLLEAKLLLDARARRGEASLGMLKNIGFVAMFLMYMLVGLILGPFAFMEDDPGVFLTLFTSAALVMLLLPLIVDFGPILLDADDVRLLSPLPVEDRTVLAVRVTHVAVYVLALVTALSIGPLVFASLSFSPWVAIPGVLFGEVQAAGLAFALVLVLYLGALKSLDLSRFRDAMVYVQVGAFMLFYLATQLGPHLVRELPGLEAFLERPELKFLWPPCAAGALGQLLAGAGGTLEVAVLASGVTATALLAAFATGLGKRGYLARLGELEGAGGPPRSRPRRAGPSLRLARRLSRDPIERAGWEFFLSLSSAERSFKTRVLPMFTVTLVPVILFAVLPNSDDLRQVAAYAEFAPYVLLFMQPGIWDTARFSESFDARWLFESLGRGERAAFVGGARRGLLARFFLVPALLLGALAVAFGGWSALGGVLFATALSFVAVCWMLTWFKHMPFTVRFSQSEARSNFALLFATFPVVAALGVGHYALGLVPFALPAGALVLVLFVPLAWRGLSHVRR